MQDWPEADETLIDPDVEMTGESIKEITAAIRRYKSERGLALNAKLDNIEIYSTLADISDIAGAANSVIKQRSGSPDFEMNPVAIKANMKSSGKQYRSRAKA